MSPLYDYTCEGCSRSKQEMRLIAEREEAPDCDHCKSPMKLEVSPVRGFVKNPAVARSNR